jgi:hypothetical protein
MDHEGQKLNAELTEAKGRECRNSAYSLSDFRSLRFDLGGLCVKLLSFA